ncbi:hypothetical protein Tco_1496873, partial [Tanacetum coccineum]
MNLADGGRDYGVHYGVTGARRRASDVVMMIIGLIMEFSTLKRRKAACKDSYTAEWWFCFGHGYWQ